MSPKHADQPYSEARVLAIVGDPLARRLIDGAKKKQVADVSMVLSTELPITWPGSGAGNHRQPYLKVPLFFAPHLGIYHTTHLLDAHAGTHLVPPSYALPPEGFDNQTYARKCASGWPNTKRSTARAARAVSRRNKFPSIKPADGAARST